MTYTVWLTIRHARRFERTTGCPSLYDKSVDIHNLYGSGGRRTWCEETLVFQEPFVSAVGWMDLLWILWIMTGWIWTAYYTMRRRLFELDRSVCLSLDHRRGRCSIFKMPYKRISIGSLNSSWPQKSTEHSGFSQWRPISVLSLTQFPCTWCVRKQPADVLIVCSDTWRTVFTFRLVLL